MEALLCYDGISGLCIWLTGKKSMSGLCFNTHTASNACYTTVLALQESNAARSLKEMLLLLCIIVLEVSGPFCQASNIFPIFISNNIASWTPTLGV